MGEPHRYDNSDDLEKRGSASTGALVDKGSAGLDYALGNVKTTTSTPSSESMVARQGSVDIAMDDRRIAFPFRIMV